MTKINMIGLKFGRLTVLSEVENSNPIKWNCICECGNLKNNVDGSKLRNGNTKSCGCLAKEVSRQTLSMLIESKDRTKKTIYGIGYIGNSTCIGKNKRLYGIWARNISKCYNTNDKDYKKYGALGVTVCEKWHSFENFLNDVQLLEGWEEELFYSPIKHLDKDFKSIDNGNKKIYSLETCIWRDPKENVGDTSKSVKVIAINILTGEKIEIYNQKKFAEEHNISKSAIGNVLSGRSLTAKGWKFKYADQK